MFCRNFFSTLITFSEGTIFLCIEIKNSLMQKSKEEKNVRPPQSQTLPGKESEMKPLPKSEPVEPKQGKLTGKKALITGGDSGIGKAVALLFASEGADIAISYLSEDDDASEVAKSIIGSYNKRCLLLPGDVGQKQHCENIVEQVIKEFGTIDILVNNAGVQFVQKTLEDISQEQLLKTFSTNIFSMFYLTAASLKYMKEGSCIINTTSVTAYRGSGSLIDYSSTKGAIVSFTRSLSANLIDRKIRVNGVAPGPVWTPLIPATFEKEDVATHGSDSPMGRAGEPNEIAPAYLFLASKDGSYFTGQILHPNGGEIING